MRKYYISDLFSIVLIILIGFLIVFSIYSYFSTGFKILSVSIISLLLGVIFQSFKISSDWKTVAYILIFSFILSTFFFINKNGDNLSINFLGGIEVTRSVVFLMFYLFISSIFLDEKIQVELDEEITLLQSISLIYWLSADGFFSFEINWLLPVKAMILLLTVVSIFNGLTGFPLSKNNRFLLSFWSSGIILFFSIDYILRVYNLPESDYHLLSWSALNQMIQHFLLGISSIFMFHNLMLFMKIIPVDGYLADLREFKDTMVKRYSENQISTESSLICIIVSGSWYWLNYKFELVPSYIAIWSCFFLYPGVSRLAIRYLFTRRLR